MKFLLSAATAILLFSQAVCQDLPGYRTGNYTGVHSVFFNPANIADTRFAYDFNLFGVGANAVNNKVDFSIKDIHKTLDGDSIKNIFFSSKNGLTSAIFSFNWIGPSLLIPVNKKLSVAVTSRARSMLNIVSFDGKLASEIIAGGNNETNFPYTVKSSGNMIETANIWSEFGLSAAGIILEKGNHFFKGGGTLKYLAGVSNTYLNIQNLNATIDVEPGTTDETYITNALGKLNFGFGGAQIENIQLKDLLKFTSSGIGIDLGLVYEYRTKKDAYLLSSDKSARRDMNKYLLKVGAAILDAGSIKFQRNRPISGDYSLHIPGGEKFSLNSFNDLDEYKDTLSKYPQYFTEGAAGNDSYKVSLPTTLQLDIDYHIQKGIYLNFASQVSLSHTDKKISNSQYYNSFTLTPRFENRAIGVYVPINYNSLAKLTAGFAVRLGPLFAGSGSILTAALGRSKQVDFFFGIRVHRLFKNKQKELDKAKKLIEKT